MMGTRYSTI